MNVILVDEDTASRELLRTYVEETSFLKLSATFKSIKEAEAKLKVNCEADLIIIDIGKNELKGIDFLNTENEIPQIIVISNKKEHAFDAYANNIIDYLLKPLNYERFLKALKKIRNINGRNQNSLPNTDFIFVRNKSKLEKITVNEIEYAEANADYVNIFTQDMKYVVHSSMKNIEAKFPFSKFIRVHRSFIVNLEKIKTIEENTLYLTDKSVSIGRIYKEHLLQRLNLI